MKTATHFVAKLKEMAQDVEREQKRRVHAIDFEPVRGDIQLSFRFKEEDDEQHPEV